MVKKETRSSDISANIASKTRELITRGVLAPGVHLGQMELAERFNASRVPVREALKLLAAEGVIQHDPNRGFFVAKISSDEARQLYRIRHLVEADLLTTIDWPNKKQLTDLHKMMDELEILLKEQKRDLWAILHREFHRKVFELSPQKVMVKEALRLWTLTDRYRSLLPTPTATKLTKSETTDERRLLDALAKRDRQRLLKVFEEDRYKIEEMLINILESRGL